MRELKRVAVSSLRPDPDQPRKLFDEADLLALGTSMKRVGQQVPLIVSDAMILDGARRWRSAQVVGMTELDVIELPARPTTAELRIVQYTLDAHRANLSAMERSDFLARTKTEHNWSVSELAEKLSIKQPAVSKLLKFQEGCDELKAALRAGHVDQDKAYAILAQESDHAKQRELLKHANDLTREQLRQKARSKGQPIELKASVARFPLPTGVMVSVQGRKMTLANAIDAMLETIRELKKGQAEHWDITTAMRVMRDRAKRTK